MGSSVEQQDGAATRRPARFHRRRDLAVLLLNCLPDVCAVPCCPPYMRYTNIRPDNMRVRIYMSIGIYWSHERRPAHDIGRRVQGLCRSDHGCEFSACSRAGRSASAIFTNAWAFRSPLASRHLAYLRKKGLVETRKDGLWVHYKLARARRAGDARADERGHARALALRCRHEEIASVSKHRPDAVCRGRPARSSNAARPASARAKRGERERAPQGSPSRTHLIVFHTTSRPNATKTIQVERCIALAALFDACVSMRRTFINVFRLSIVHCASLKRSERILYLSEHSSSGITEIFQSLQKIGNTKCSVG